MASGTDADAKFLGWQQTLSGEMFPLFNVTVPGHPSNRSTVSEEKLRALRLRVPRSLSPYPESGPPPWNTHGIELNNPRTAREAIEFAGLDYTVVKQPLKLKTELDHNAYATIRTDTGAMLGVVGENFEPLQNRDAFAFFDALVEEHEAVYDTAGVFGNGETIWVLARLPGLIHVNRNDIVGKYLLLTNSHDGSPQVRVRVTPIRVVCNNSLSSAVGESGELQFRHTYEAAKHLEQAVTLLGVSNSLYERLDIVSNKMAAKPITAMELAKYIQAIVPDNESAENTKSTEKIRNSVLHLNKSGRGAYLARGTVWGAFNSVTEYTDHMMPAGDSTAHLKSMWFGKGEQLKSKAFRLAEQMIQA